jgi:ABC-type molybdate transport system substrate-binding protein
MRNNQSGIAHLILLVLLVAVAVVGFAAYRVHSAQQTPEASTATVGSASTLTSSNKELDQADSQLDATLDDSALNSDLENL